jgi:hypothetical protein
MFLVVLRRSGADWELGRPLEKQSGWAAHAAFIDRLVDEGSSSTEIRSLTKTESCMQSTLTQTRRYERSSHRIRGARRTSPSRRGPSASTVIASVPPSSCRSSHGLEPFAAAHRSAAIPKSVRSALGTETPARPDWAAAERLLPESDSR